MDRENILAKARSDKNRGKEYENKQSMRGGLLGAYLAVLLGLALSFVEYFAKGTLNFGLIAVGATALGVQYLFEGITIKKVYLIIAGIIYFVLAIFLVLVFISQVVAA